LFKSKPIKQAHLTADMGRLEIHTRLSLATTWKKTHSWKENIKISLQEIENEDMERIQQARDRIAASMLGYALLNASRRASDDFSAK
jgi:hypothetical protein